ncbi:caspase-6-like [Diadema antillarum]|uniref:caspase-6-like n=1 Tax=Diadema antillarum TaxID=105358 RepID=UPI003A8C181C
MTSSCAPGDILKCDRKCTFSCSMPEHDLGGEAELICCENGAWSDAFPTCQDIFPDTDGCLTQKMTPAQPTEEQLDPKENYSMNLRDKGMAFILNNNNFVDRRKRKGSEVDVINVTHVFREIGYKIVVVQDLTAHEVRDALSSLKTKIRPFHTSAVLVFMSHGDREGISGKDGNIISVEEIKDIFSGRNCPHLRGKPKIFFFQACRGVNHSSILLESVHRCDDSGCAKRSPRSRRQVKKTREEVPEKELTKDKLTTSATDKTVQPVSEPDRCTRGAGSFNLVDIGDESRKGSSRDQAVISQPVEFDNVPDNAHMFIAHATCEGYVALRDNVNGSWFIQALCEELLAGAHLYDLSTIMTKVSGRVQRQRGCVRQEKGTVITYQTTQTINQGIVKRIYFLPKYPPERFTAVSRSMEAATRNHVV